MTSAGNLKILLLAHDLSDAAIQRRIAMLRAGGASVTAAGFRRTSEPIVTIDGSAAIDFGRTHNAGFLQRIAVVIGTILFLNKHRALFADADIIIARNLEMLAIGARGRNFRHPAAILVYECLDIHRLLLRRDMIGSALRTLEGWLAKRASALITSSLAFVSGYFESLSKVRLPVRLVENKVLDTGNLFPDQIKARPSGPPWVIGWFGIIRCKQSLQILKELIKRSNGAVEVIIRGRPAPDLFANFAAEIGNIPGMRFHGAYNSPGDLAAIYRNIHFNWVIDLFEQDLNSSWLLPNRLYEGGLFGAVPIATSSVESGRFLKQLGVGVTLEEPLGRSLADFFAGLTPTRYGELEQAVSNVPRSTWIYDQNDCTALVDYLRTLGRRRQWLNQR